MDIWGTNANDQLFCGAGNAVIGLGGDDFLSSIPMTGILDQVLVGGVGNDTYFATRGASTIILDVAGAYDVLYADIFLQNPSYIYTIGGKHLVFGDYVTECFLTIPDVKNCGIEVINFASGESYSFSAFYNLVKNNIANYSPYADNVINYVYKLCESYNAAKFFPQNVGQNLPPTPILPPIQTPPPAPTPNPALPLEQAVATYFNEGEYLQNKLSAMQSTGVNYTLEGLINVIASSGMTPWQHFQKFGAFELAVDGKIGIDPSAKFDISTYYEQKLFQSVLNGEHLDLTSLIKTFQNTGIDPITHYAFFGQAEGLTPTPVIPIGIAEIDNYAA